MFTCEKFHAIEQKEKRWKKNTSLHTSIVRKEDQVDVKWGKLSSDTLYLFESHETSEDVQVYIKSSLDDTLFTCLI